MIASCLRHGLGTALRLPALVGLLWLWTLGLAALAALPVATWLVRSLAWSPRGDVLLEGFRFGVAADLFEEAGPAAAMALAAAAAAALLSLAGGAVLMGGVLETLQAESGRPFLPRFLAGAGRFAGRFLRLLLLSLLAFATTAGPLAWLLHRLLRPLRESAWEPGPFASALLVLGTLALAAVVFGLALDYARIRMAATDESRVWQPWWDGLRLVLGHPVHTLGLLAAVGVLLAVAAAAYLAFRQAVPADTWPLILVMAAAQQAFAVVRAGARVSLVAAERALWARLQPALPAAHLAPPPPAVPEERSA